MLWGEVEPGDQLTENKLSKRTHRKKKVRVPEKRAVATPPRQTTQYLIERFTELDLKRWRTLSKAIYDQQTLLYFCLEGQRKTYTDKINKSLEKGEISYSFDNWSRVLEYRYSDNPLSPIGSTISVGGRFNIGDIDPKTFCPFPALYLGSDDKTVLSEYFQSSPTPTNGLSREELALTQKDAYAVVKVKGVLSRVFDLRKRENIRAFANILKTFDLSSTVVRHAKQANIELPKLLRNVDVMYSFMFEKRWRERPMQFDIPANPQIFGRILKDAGFQGILYRSVRGNGLCLAIFPENLGPYDFVELPKGTAPKSVKIQRMDWSTWRHLLEE